MSTRNEGDTTLFCNTKKQKKSNTKNTELSHFSCIYKNPTFLRKNFSKNIFSLKYVKFVLSCKKHKGGRAKYLNNTRKL